MDFIKVYSKIDFEPVEGKGAYIYDRSGNKYLDFYGGHAVISIGHRHPLWVKYLNEQINRLPFYSNAVYKSMETLFAGLLGEVSGYEEYGFFACNSGAEAVENALKLASFHTGKDKVLFFSKAFHGRTSGAVSVSDYPQNISPFNAHHNVKKVNLNDLESSLEIINHEELAAVIVEGVQGVGGVFIPENKFLKEIKKACQENNCLLILDEVQSGYGRTGRFFAHQYFDVTPDLICVAKGMGNGFPMGGVLVSPNVKYTSGQLGSTFGGNQMALAAGIAVLEVIKNENLIDNAQKKGEFLMESFKTMSQIKEVRGKGLMIALELPFEDITDIKNDLLFNQKLVVGQSGKNILRLLPPLNIDQEQAEEALQAIENTLKKF